MLIAGIIQYLLTQSAVTALVAQENAIQPIPAPPELTDANGNPLFPCITLQTASDVPEYTLTGPAGLSPSRVVFNCLAPLNPGGYLIAKNLATAVKAALSGYSGTLPDGTRVFFAQVVNVVDAFDNDSFLVNVAVHVMFTYSD